MKSFTAFFLAISITLLCIITLAITRYSSSTTNTNEKTLVVGMMSGWAPFMTINKDGNYEGFDVDVAQEIAQRMQCSLTIQDLGSLASCFVALDQKRIDLILSGLDITQKRLEKIAMIPYTGEDTKEFKLIFWNNVPTNINRMEDLRTIQNAVICVESGSAQEKFLDNYDFVEKKRMNSIIDSVLDVRFGKSLAAIAEPRIAARLQKQNPEIKSISVALPKDFQVFGCGIAINKENTQLITTVEIIIKQMRTDGTLKQLEQKWQMEE